jgi:radical SAM superfamily enzyme YgiQ (UPF0313 family)
MARNRKPATSLLGNERGTLFKHGAVSVALGYPAPYRVGVSSLGFQSVYRALNAVSEVACSRFFAPDGAPQKILTTLETGRAVADMHAVLFSVAYEQELLELVSLFRAMGLAPLAAHRRPADPVVIMGGPLTTVDPRLLFPFADVVATGGADHLFAPLGEALVRSNGDKPFLLASIANRYPGLYVTSLGPFSAETPSPAVSPETPAAAVTWSPDAEFRNLFLVEATRGCRRGCAFCTLSRHSANTPPFHAFSVDQIVRAVPEDAPGVGLVGAAVTDHPEIERLTAILLEKGKRVSLSSIRADRLTLGLATTLRQGGGRTLTLAADGASERLRRRVRKGIREQHLIDAVAIAREAGFQSLKLYAMVGLPGEEASDIDEYAALLVALSRSLKVSTTVQAFVPKPNTPLAHEPMTELRGLMDRLDRLRRLTKGKVNVLPTSPKWSYVDWKIAHAGEKAALMAIDAEAAGGGFAAWKRAVERHML